MGTVSGRGNVIYGSTCLRRNHLLLTSTRRFMVLTKYRLCLPISTTTPYRSNCLVSGLPIVMSGRGRACWLYDCCMSQQLGNEVERQGKQVNYTQDSSFFSKKRRTAALGGIRTHDTLQSRRALYQLSYQGNSAGRGSNLQNNTTQGKPQTTLWHSKLSLSM